MSSLHLYPVPPFRLDLTVWVLRRLPINAMDRWDGQRYQRTLILEDDPIRVTITQTAPPPTPVLDIALEGPHVSRHDEAAIRAFLEKMLGLTIDLTDFYQRAAADPRLAALIGRFHGVKPPRLPSVFEALVNGIACQQLSLTVGITLLNRLCAAYGLAVDEQHAFPRPDDLCDATVPDLRALGYSTRKAENILGLAQALVQGELDLEALNAVDDATAVARLLELPGVGRWTAQYVLLRGLGRLDMFPADDVGSQAKLQRWLGLESRPDYAGMHQILDRWAPYRGLLYFYLLLDQLTRTGAILETQG